MAVLIQMIHLNHLNYKLICFFAPLTFLVFKYTFSRSAKTIPLEAGRWVQNIVEMTILT